MVKEVMACPKCGSKDISAVKQGTAWLNEAGALMGIYTCQKCGYQGLPIILDSEKDHKNLLKGLKK